MSEIIVITATLPVLLDDKLRPSSKLAHERAPTVMKDANLKAVVNRKIRTEMRDNAQWVLPQFKAPSRPLFGIIPRATVVSVQLRSWHHAWRGNGTAALHFEWEAALPQGATVDAEAIRAVIAGGISDGWGEGAEQMGRFGELCVLDEEEGTKETDIYRRAKPGEKTKLGLTVQEQGRYALLLTLKGAKLVIKKKKK